MPLDVDPGDVEGTALRLNDITDLLRNCGADNVVMVLDACRSQGKRKGVGVGGELQQGVVTIYSCSPKEASYEIEELKHGSFTYALLEGMRLQGATNCATVERLDQYLRYQVPDLNQRYDKPRQTPYTAVEPVAKQHLILLSKQASLSDVLVLKNTAQAAELEGDLELGEQLWIRVLAASSADRQAISALQRIAVRRERGSSQTSPAIPSSPAGTSRSIIEESIEAGESKQEDSPLSTTDVEKDSSVSKFSFDVVTITGVEQTAGILGFGSKTEILTNRQRKEAKFFAEKLENGSKLEMVFIPAGTFQMGAPSKEEGRSGDEGPQHEVTVPAFWMSKYAVTQEQWRAVTKLPKVERVLESDPSRFKRNTLPVERVCWYDAVEFCKRLAKKTGRNYRLPSEAEWEYACRAGTTTPFHFGETITSDFANYEGTYTYGNGPKGVYRAETTFVGSFGVANAFGLYDMHGNVWEWCEDHWHANYMGAPSGGTPWIEGGDSNRRVLRGGSWYNDPRNCRSADRNWFEPDYRNDFIGFRVVCSSA